MNTDELPIEVDTDELTVDDLIEIQSRAPSTCNGFAFLYAEQSDNDVVVKDGFVDGPSSGEHCYVYDRDRDVTIDVCLMQFDAGPDMGAWDGEEHPYTADWEETREWESREEFEDHYGQLDEHENPFYL